MHETPAPPGFDEAIRSGDLATALEILKGKVRNDPAAPHPRLVLFEVFSLLGDWKRAAAQLDAFSELTQKQSPLSSIFSGILHAESARTAVFAGTRSPEFMLEPAEWIVKLVRALSLDAAGQTEEAEHLRLEALDDAPAGAGSINGSDFEWMMDGDSRLGPVIEMYHRSRYCWVPQPALAEVTWERTASMHSLAWISGRAILRDGSELTGFFPVRYPGAENWASDSLRLSRATEWQQIGKDAWAGRGQRMLITSAAEWPMLNVTSVKFPEGG